jgi:GTP cyclohydrolase I
LDSNGIHISSAESETETQKVVSVLYDYCSKVYPERFFDILYKNEKIFHLENNGGESTNVNTHFLPNIDFRVLWNTEGISDATRETIWKYLQLILMSIITNIEDRKSFGDAANLFEAINEDELRNKLEETIQQMYNMFEGTDANANANANANASSEHENASANDNTGSSEAEFNFFEWAKKMNKNGHGDGDGCAESNAKGGNSANAESIHDHISHILNGKIGKLAKEIAEETAKDVDFEMEFGGENGENMDFKNVFQKMFKNPGKLMSLVKNVGSKLDQKFKSGEIKESELMQEASDLLSKMKGMPGMNNLADMLNKMGMGGMMGGMGGGGGKSKVNIGAMQSHLQRNMKVSQMKERMQQKLKLQQQQRDAALAAATATAAAAPPVNSVKTPQVFSTGEVVERTPIEASPSLSKSDKKKKKK